MGKKKCSVFSVGLKLVGTITGVAAAFVGSNVAVGCLLYHKNMKKMNQQENQNNLMNTVFLGNKTVEINKDTHNAFVTCLTSNVKVMLPMPAQEKMTIEIFSMFSNVNLVCPEGVNLSFEGSGIINVAPELVHDEEIQGAPEIRIVRKMIASNVKMTTA